MAFRTGLEAGPPMGGQFFNGLLAAAACDNVQLPFQIVFAKLIRLFCAVSWPPL
jgi:hypothetical protein